MTGDYTLQTMDFQRGYHFLSSNDFSKLALTWKTLGQSPGFTEPNIITEGYYGEFGRFNIRIQGYTVDNVQQTFLPLSLCIIPKGVSIANTPLCPANL